jgi:hypothetical protein
VCVPNDIPHVDIKEWIDGKSASGLNRLCTFNQLSFSEGALNASVDPEFFSTCVVKAIG